jgi:hypothetical protein
MTAGSLPTASRSPQRPRDPEVTMSARSPLAPAPQRSACGWDGHGTGRCRPNGHRSRSGRPSWGRGLLIPAMPEPPICEAIAGADDRIADLDRQKSINSGSERT